MAQSTFSLARYKDPATVEFVRSIDQRTLAVWAIDCVEHVLPYFEDMYPHDQRPRQALAALQTWIQTGVFKMAVIRRASLTSHAAAREVGADTAARSVAHAAGQAVATAHVPLHALGAANYALQAIYRATDPSQAEAALANERARQLTHLRELRDARHHGGDVSGHS
jgi:hypothetical protein